MMKTLQSALSLLDDQHHGSLKEEWKALLQYMSQDEVRVAVLGPFNQGKSTLLNALLGSRELPIDIVPTTGSAIFIREGEMVETRVTLRDGSRFQEPGCALLQRFAVLNEQRRMSEQVESVEIRHPHPILRGGVTLVDLPGTNDRPSQEDIVRRELFFADVVVQVLNARQLFTLEEESKLLDWVLERDIQHILFAVNFCNLLEREEQKSVLARARASVKSLAGKLSSHSRLYRVDALPALRSQLRGDGKEFNRSGIANFAVALRQAAKEVAENKVGQRSKRLVTFAEKVLDALSEQQRREEAGATAKRQIGEAETQRNESQV